MHQLINYTSESTSSSRSPPSLQNNTNTKLNVNQAVQIIKPTQSRLLIRSPLLSSPLYLSIWAPLLPRKRRDKATLRLLLWLISVPLRLQSHFKPQLRCLVVWAYRYQPPPPAVPKWGERHHPGGLSECLPEITLIPISLLRHLKKKN